MWMKIWNDKHWRGKCWFIQFHGNKACSINSPRGFLSIRELVKFEGEKR